MRSRFRSKMAAAIVIGLLTAALPAAVLAYESGSSGSPGGVVAQATGTATPTSTATATATGTATATATRTATATGTGTPSAPQTGSAGFVDGRGSIVMSIVLLTLATSMVAGGRLLTVRRRD